MAKNTKSPRSSTPAKRKSSRSNATPANGKKAVRYVYNFGDGKADGAGNMKPLLGGKGANLAEMTKIGAS